MIGAVILKLALRGAMDDLNKRRKDKIVASYADDAVMIYPGKMSVSGTRKGKAAVKEFFDKYFDQFTEEHCVAEETYMKNIFAVRLMGYTLCERQFSRVGVELASFFRAVNYRCCRISPSVSRLRLTATTSWVVLCKAQHGSRGLSGGDSMLGFLRALEQKRRCLSRKIPSSNSYYAVGVFVFMAALLFDFEFTAVGIAICIVAIILLCTIVMAPLGCGLL